MAVQADIAALQRMRESVRRQGILIATQHEIAHAERELDAVLSIVTRRAQELSEADGAVVEMADGDEMVYRSASGSAAHQIGMRLSRLTSLSGRCVAEGRVLLCEDSETDPRVNREACRKVGLRSMAVVPLQFLGQTIGVLKVYSSRPSAFDAHVLPLIEMMVSLIVAAMSAVSEAEARRALSISEARQQTLLRDVLASVTEGKLRLCSAAEELPESLTPFGEPVSLAERVGLRELRNLTQEAARAAGHTESRQSDIATAASEAAMNAMVHGGGGMAWVLVGENGTVRVRVEDHGSGIAMENLPKATLARGFSTKATLGHGLKMMLETSDRLYLLTGPGGTTVIVEQDENPPLPAWLADAFD
ncbi:MAG: diguanylate cyclase [Capsulimonas sp.]|jgi:anti-sigma regulatory factor (Ser/Thr protein kinase)/putative methionine-R-sulfoxide reductase with GAF domain|nr:diguanylate cyclase [Capsulimonas sp.]